MAASLRLCKSLRASEDNRYSVIIAIAPQYRDHMFLSSTERPHWREIAFCKKPRAFQPLPQSLSSNDCEVLEPVRPLQASGSIQTAVSEPR